jgi:hypothetical protein
MLEGSMGTHCVLYQSSQARLQNTLWLPPTFGFDVLRIVPDLDQSHLMCLLLVQIIPCLLGRMRKGHRLPAVIIRLVQEIGRIN